MTRVLLLIPDRTYRTADFMAAAADLGVEIVVGTREVSPLAATGDGRFLRVPLDDVSEAIVIEELSRCDASAGVVVAVHCGLCSKTLVVWGSEEQKQRYLPRLATGEIASCYALTEPGSGSDSLAMRTKWTDPGSWTSSRS